MKVVCERPPLEFQCGYCNSKLLIGPEEIRADKDPMWSRKELGWADYQARATCIVCDKIMPLGLLCGLPEEWREPILKSSGLSGNEQHEQYSH